MYCSQCGKGIPDNSKFCNGCGSPVSTQIENQVSESETNDKPIFTSEENFSSDYVVTPKHNTSAELENTNSATLLQPNVKKKRLKSWHKVLIGVASVICVIVILFVALILIPAVRGANAYNKISPYLNYVGNSHPDAEESITLTEQEYNNIDNVKLLGMNGEVTFQLRNGYISSCTWTSSDFCSEEKYRSFADDLYVLFDSEPKVVDYSYGNGNTYRYYWTDPYYDLDVTMAHGFSAYDPEGKIEIKWEVPKGSIEVEKDIEMVERIYSMSYKEILTEFQNVEEPSPDSNDRNKGLYIESTFAEIQGEYYVYIYDGYVDRVIFEPEDKETNGKYIAEALEAFLGKCDEYDEEWNTYTWKSKNLKIECYVEERTYFDWIGEDLEVNNEDSSEIGVVDNIHTAADIPNELMNDEFKSVIDLFSKGYSQSGLDIANATTSDDGETYIFYFDNLEFLEEECDDSHLQPRIIYDKDAIENNGTPSKIYFGYYNPLKSNGYKETVEKVEDIAEALGISDEGLIDNDYTSSSKLAIGDYATFTFTNLKLELTVSNTDGEVEIEIVPMD